MVLFDTTYAISHLFWFIVVFLSLYLAISRFFIKKLMNLMDSRVLKARNMNEGMRDMMLEIELCHRKKASSLDAARQRARYTHEQTLKNMDQKIKQEILLVDKNLSQELDLLTQSLQKKKELFDENILPNLEESMRIFRKKIEEGGL